MNRCGDYPKVDPSCIMVPDPKDPTCCQVPECPLIPSGGTTPGQPTIIRPTQPTAVFTNMPTPSPRPEVTPARGPDGNTLSPQPASTQVPELRTGGHLPLQLQCSFFLSLIAISLLSRVFSCSPMSDINASGSWTWCDESATVI